MEYHNFDKSGEVLREGAGLEEQMSYGNRIYYSDFSLDLIENALYELSASKIPMSERKFVLRTGERGAAQFSKAVQEKISGWQPFLFDNNSVRVVNKTSSELHQNSLSAGYQFVEYLAPNGVVLTIEVDPLTKSRAA